MGARPGSVTRRRKSLTRGRPLLVTEMSRASDGVVGISGPGPTNSRCFPGTGGESGRQLWRGGAACTLSAGVTLPAENAPSLEELGAGQTLGRYELLMPIASGGMAMVWAARLKGTRGFQKIVAVKTILPKLSDDPEFEQMFLDEASLASQIRHPHVVEILDLGEQDGVLYLVMEWIDGVPLNQVIRAAKKVGGVPLPVAVRICTQAAAGLHAAHEIRDGSGQLVGLVHRDVSPQNVLVTYDGVAKVVDFGVAKATAVGGSVTAAGHIKGKVGYMAPEQIRAETIDRRIDVFSLGCVLYYLTTGKHPFRKESDAATMYNIAAPDLAITPRRLVPSYPVALDRVVMQALAKDPAKRFPTANDLLRALDQSLPTTMRASTDEEVAKFLRSLFSERREQQKSALNAALTRADNAKSQGPDTERKLRDLLDSQPPPSAASGSGVSGIASFSSSGTSAPTLGSGETTGASVSQVLFPAPSFDVPKRSVWPKLLLLLIVVGGGCALYFFVIAPRLKPEPESPPVVASPSPSPSPTSPALSSVEPEVAPPAEPVASEPAAEESAPPPVDSAPPVPTHHPAATKPAKPSATKPAKPTNPPSWKQDPGF